MKQLGVFLRSFGTILSSKRRLSVVSILILTTSVVAGYFVAKMFIWPSNIQTQGQAVALPKNSVGFYKNAVDAGLPIHDEWTTGRVATSRNSETIAYLIEQRYVGAGELSQRGYYKLYISKDGGKSWVESAVPFVKYPEAILQDLPMSVAVSPSGDKIVVATGRLSHHTQPSLEVYKGVLVSQDDGNTWTEATLPNNDFAVYARFGSDSTIWAASSRTPQASFYRSIDAGKSWETLSVANNIPDHFVDASFSDDGSRIALSTLESIASLSVTDDSGVTWHSRENFDNPTGTAMTKIHVVGMSTDGKRLSVVASGCGTSQESTCQVMLFSSTNLGKTWSAIQVSDSAMSVPFTKHANVAGRFSSSAQEFVGKIDNVLYSASMRDSSIISTSVPMDDSVRDVAIFANDQKFFALTQNGYYVGNL